MLHKLIIDIHRSAAQVDMFRLFEGTLREFLPQFRANSRACSAVLHCHSYGPTYRYINGIETGGHYEKTHMDIQDFHEICYKGSRSRRVIHVRLQASPVK